MNFSSLMRLNWMWALLCSAAALGQTNKAGPDLGWTDAQNNGAFTESISIVVPAFHGLEPHLSVNYNSDSSFGLMGTGWSLSGFSIIERSNYGRGAPSYNGLATVTSDVFLLDGRDLTPCQAGHVSPSCSAGGNFATLVESYEKIFYNTSNDTWTITDQEGTVYVYSPIYQRPCSTCAGNFSGNVTWRYGITSATNVLGDTVTYNWVQNKFSSQWTGPASITYNGNTINLNYLQVATNSPIRYADGIGLTSIYGVIQSIDVQAGGSRARAYQFSYGTSNSTKQMLMTKVQEFGKDAVIDSTGAVTSGTAMPAITMNYTGNQAQFVAQSGYGQFAAYNSNDMFLNGDVNGDGYQDLVALTVNGTRWNRQIWWGTSAGTFSAGPTDSNMDYTTVGQYFMTDVNGDGKADMIEVCGNSARCGTSTWTRHIWLSNGSAFTSSGQDGSMYYNVNSQFLIADVNGDGKQDMVELWPYNGTQILRRIWPSTGTSFQTTGTQDYLGRYSTTPSYYLAADLDGDGKTDMVEIHIDSNNTNWDMQTWISGGTSFVIGYATPDKSMTYNSSSQFLVEDFNGDGKTDLVELRPGPGTWWTRVPHASKGYTFTTLASDTAMSYQSTAVEHYFTGDFNGDGRADMLELSDYQMLNQRYWRQLWLYTPANMGSFRAGVNDTADGYISNTQYLAMDVNGDGLTDIVEVWHQGSYWAQHTWLNTAGGIPDLLATINSESGGTTTISYTPSSAWSNTNNPAVMQTVASVTESDGRGWSATTNYSYSGGLYDWAAHKFQGFQTVTTTEPCLAGESSCPYTVETFDRPSGCGTQSPLLSVDSYDGLGNKYSHAQSDITYNCSSSPFTGLITGQWEYTYDPNNPTTYKRTYTSSAYDAYGNVTQTINYGDYDVTGDEVNTVAVFNYNTSAYLVAHPARGTTYAGTTTGGAMLAQTLTYYDCDPVTLQNCNNSAAPTKGLVNRVDEYLDRQSYSNQASSYLTAKTLYDSHGNATDIYDANNNHTSVAYDTTYSVFATKATNALGQSGTMGFDTVCGRETSITDVNSQTTTTTLDALCRPTQVSFPGGGYMKTQYVNSGNPATQYTETDSPGPSGDIYARDYFDGLGRSYKHVSRGASVDTETDSTFDARGNLSTVTNPYFVGSASVVTTYNYDALNRATKVTLPDNSTTQNFYGPNANCNGCNVWSETGIDPLGHKQTDWSDAHGNRVQHDEYVGGSWNSATYTYSLLNHPSTSTDPSGNVITYTVDSLGRVVGTNDPDRGLWTFTFDANGNLLTETDAAGTSVVSYAYDAVNRITSKTTSGDGNTFTWTYDQAQVGYYNVGKLTTKTDPYGSETYNYDNVGNAVAVTRTTDGVSYPFSFTFDNAGRMLTETYPDGDSIGTIAYDVAGRVSSVPNLVTSVAYDALDRPTQLVNGNGTTQSWTYDPNRQWTTAITTTSGSTNLQALTYGFDADGNRTSVTSNSSNSTDESWTYGYDELHRVTSAVDNTNSAYSQSFTFNAAGNIVSNSRVGSYTYPAQGAGSVRPHAVTAAGGNSYGYDANGQMTSRAGTNLTWNGDHLLANDGSNSYSYDGDRDLLKLVNGGNTTRYLGDNFEVSPSGTQNKYLSVAGVPISVRVGTGSAASRWIHSDFNRTIQVQSDGTGAESMRKKYYVTGDAISTTGTDSESRGFTGQRQESSGLTYLHERFYDPLLGRFISGDPVTPGHHGNAGLNRYAYAMNDFVNKEDTSGFMFLPGDGHPGPYRAPKPVSHYGQHFTPICYYCYKVVNKHPVDLGGTHTNHWWLRNEWTPICYYCYKVVHHHAVDLGGHYGGHLFHYGLRSCPIAGCYHPAARQTHHGGGGGGGGGGGHHCGGMFGFVCSISHHVANFVDHHRTLVSWTLRVAAVAAIAVCIATIACGATAGTLAGVAWGMGAGITSGALFSAGSSVGSGGEFNWASVGVGAAAGALTMLPFIPGPAGAIMNMGKGTALFKSLGIAGAKSFFGKGGASFGLKLGVDLAVRVPGYIIRAQANRLGTWHGQGYGSALYDSFLLRGM
jgi:RHS repeat-associated protein